MGLLTFNREGAARFLADAEVAILAPYARLAHKKLLDGSGPGSDFTGWLRLPSGYDRDEYKRIKDSAAKIRGDSEVLIVIGIGGSYLGARAAIDTLSHNFVNLQGKAGRAGPQILYAGNSLSPTYLADLLELVDGRELSVNVISKSGTTTEPAIAFRVFKEYMEKRYGREAAAKRIYATTDRKAGALKKLADEERYETFVIPDSVGGRFSVLTAVGLLPIAAAGIDTDALLSGAREAEDAYTATAELDRNDSLAYAVVRNALYRKGYTTEILANYEPNLHFFNEWWKQLYGESEGKDHKGIFPAAVDFTTDLHSMGQYVQDGLRNIFETVLEVGAPKRNLTVKSVEGDLDGLNFLAGRDLDYINKMAAKGTAEAHIDGGVPNLKVRFPALDAASFGSAVYFFEMACAVSGYLLGVNPFDQPGVEFYKRNMFKLLGKPGY